MRPPAFLSLAGSFDPLAADPRPFPPSLLLARLVQMAQARFPDRYLTLPLLHKLLGRILVSPLPSLSHLEGLLPNLERFVLEHDIRGIVIDNIAVRNWPTSHLFFFFYALNFIC